MPAAHPSHAASRTSTPASPHHAADGGDAPAQEAAAPEASTATSHSCAGRHDSIAPGVGCPRRTPAVAPPDTLAAARSQSPRRSSRIAHHDPSALDHARPAHSPWHGAGRSAGPTPSLASPAGHPSATNRPDPLHASAAEPTPQPSPPATSPRLPSTSSPHAASTTATASAARIRVTTPALAPPAATPLPPPIAPAAPPHRRALTHAPRALSRAPPLPTNWPSATPQGQETRLLAEATNLQQMGWPARWAGSSAPPAWRRRTKTTERREPAAAPTSPPAPQLDTQGPNRKARCFANHPCFCETSIIIECAWEGRTRARGRWVIT